MSEIDDSLADLLLAEGNRMSRLEASVLGSLPVPLTYRQHRLLARISEGHHSPQVLASFGSLSMPALSESLSVLARRGLVQRHPSPTDRRAIVLHITAEGRKAHRAGVEALRATVLSLLPDLGGEEGKRAFFEQLNAVHNGIDAYFPPALAGVRRGLNPKKGTPGDRSS